MEILYVTDVRYLLLCQSHISSGIVNPFLFKQSLIIENLLLGAITHVKNISKKKPSVKRLLPHINSPGANNWGVSVVEETLCNMRTKGIINENYKIFTTNNANTLPSDDELLEISLVSSTDNTLTDPNLLLFQESQFSTSTSTAPTIYSTVTSVTNLTFQGKF